MLMTAKRHPGVSHIVRAPTRNCRTNDPRSPTCGARNEPRTDATATINTANDTPLIVMIHAGESHTPRKAASADPTMRPAFHDTAPSDTALSSSSRGTSDGISD